MLRLAEYCNRLSVPKLIFVLNCAMCRWFLWYHQYLLMVLNISRKPESTVAWSNLVWWKADCNSLFNEIWHIYDYSWNQFFPSSCGKQLLWKKFLLLCHWKDFCPVFLGGSKVIHFSWKRFLVIKIFWSCESFSVIARTSLAISIIISIIYSVCIILS